MNDDDFWTINNTGLLKSKRTVLSGEGTSCTSHPTQYPLRASDLNAFFRSCRVHLHLQPSSLIAAGRQTCKSLLEVAGFGLESRGPEHPLIYEQSAMLMWRECKQRHV